MGIGDAMLIFMVVMLAVTEEQSTCKSPEGEGDCCCGTTLPVLPDMVGLRHPTPPPCPLFPSPSPSE